MFVIGAKATIGIALAAIAYGAIARPSSRKRASRSASRIADPEPITKPPSASLNVNQPALTKVAQSRVWRMSESGGSRNSSTSKPRV